VSGTGVVDSPFVPPGRIPRYAVFKSAIFSRYFEVSSMNPSAKERSSGRVIIPADPKLAASGAFGGPVIYSTYAFTGKQFEISHIILYLWSVQVGGGTAPDGGARDWRCLPEVIKLPYMMIQMLL
jgi:hypothetical protein